MRLLEQYRELQAQGKFPGLAMLPFVPDIAELVNEFDSKTILDYGCGLGFQYTREKAYKAWGMKPPALYDPAVDRYSIKPEGQFDGVICTDVLEHVPADELDAMVREIAGYARQWAFVSVCQPSLDWWGAFLPPFFFGQRLVLRQSECPY